MTLVRAGFCRTAIRRGTTTMTTAAAPPLPIPVTDRGYSSTVPAFDNKDNDNGDDDQKVAAKSYNSSRSNYRKAIGNLRRRYLEDHLEAEKMDKAAKEAAVAATTRSRLERQRAKNERTFRNAMRQEELRRQAHAAFEDKLRINQVKREADRALHLRARQLLLDELEEESSSWLTTPEEVETAFDDPTTEQALWARPQGCLGVPNPSLDSHFWEYEGHTWDRSKTYKTRSELLLEELEREAYDDTNVDPNHWTPSKLRETERLETKARLRALVRQAGRRALLRRQKDYVAEEQSQSQQPGAVPSPPPIPSLAVLGNTRAQEREGAELLLQDPTKFFVFDRESTAGSGSSGESYDGTSLGAPVGLKDPLRTGKPQNRVFPVPVGKLPKPDLRTEKEKKRQEREDQMWAAAGKATSAEESDEELLLAEEDRVIGEAVDYEEAHESWDSDDEEWEKGLDEDLDRDLLGVPREYRYRDQDLDSVIAGLEARAGAVQSHVSNTIRSMEQEALSRLDPSPVEENEDADADGDAAADASTDREPFFDADTTLKLRALGADVGKYEALMASLTDRQLLALFGSEAREDGGGVAAATEDEPVDDEIASAPSTEVFRAIGGLTEPQIEGLTELESFLNVAEQEEQQQQQ